MNGYLTAVVDVTDVQTVWMRVAMAMLHSLWIGAAIGVFALIVFMALRASRRHARYNVLVASLLPIAASPLLVFFALAPETTMETFDPLALRPPVEMAGRLVFTKPAEPPVVDEATESVSYPEPVKLVDEAGTVYVAPEVVPGEYAANDFIPVVREDAQAARQKIVVSPKWIVIAYMAIACALLLRLAIGIAGGSRLRRTSQLVTDGAVLSALARHTQSLGMRITPAIAYCARVAVPTVVGVVRPIILLPLSTATGMTPEQVEYLVLHELAHIRRYDHIVNLLQRVIEAVMFYHPVVWLISRQIRIEREHCCDDVVVRLGGDAQHYAESLLAAATFAQGFNVRRAVPTLSATGKTSHLRQRIARILGEPAPAMRLRHTGWVFALLCAFAGIVAIAQLDSSKAPLAREALVNPDNESDEPEPQSVAATPPSTDISQSVLETFNSQPTKRNEASKEDTAEPVAFLQEELCEFVKTTEGVKRVSGSIREINGKPGIVLTLYVAPETTIDVFSEQLKTLDERAYEFMREKAPDVLRYGDGARNDAVTFAIAGDEAATNSISTQQQDEISPKQILNQLKESATRIRGVSGADGSFTTRDGENLILLQVKGASGVKQSDIQDELEQLRSTADELAKKYKSVEDQEVTIDVDFLPWWTQTDSEKFKALASGLGSVFGKPAASDANVDTIGADPSQLQDKDWWLRKLAIQQLVEANQPDAWRLIVPLLKDEDPRVQAAAATALGQLKEPQSIKHLVAALKEERETSEAAAKALGQFEPSQAMTLIHIAINDEDSSVRRGGVRALREVKSSEVPEVLVGVLAKVPLGGQARGGARRQDIALHLFTSDFLSVDVASTLEGFDSDSLQKVVEIAMQNADWRIRAGLMKVLAVPLFTDNAITPSEVRPETAALLNQDPVVTAQIGALQDPQKDVRAWAAVGLGLAYGSLTDNSELSKRRTEALVASMRDNNLFISRLCGTYLRFSNAPIKWQPSNDDENIAFQVANSDINGIAGFGKKAVPALITTSTADPTFPLSDVQGNLSDRNVIAIALAQIGGLEVIDPLLAMLDIAGPDCVLTICDALGNIGDARAVEPLIGIAGHGQGRSQLIAINALGKLKDERAFEVLISALESPNHDLHIAGAGALGEIGDARAVPILINSLTLATDEKALIVAVGSLGKLKDPAAVPILQETLKSSGKAAREVTAGALGQIGGSQARDGLISALRTDPYPDVRVAVANALGAIKDSEAIAPLSEALRFDEENVQRAAAVAIANVGTPEAFEALRTAMPLSQGQSGSRSMNRTGIHIVDALCESEEPAALDLLYQMLRDGSIPLQKVQLRAALALAEKKDPRAREFLDQLRGTPQTRIESERALDELFGQPREAPADANESLTPPATEASPSVNAGDASTPNLQFRLVLDGAEAEGKARFAAPTKDDPNRTIALADDVLLTENHLASAVARVNPDSQENEVLFSVGTVAGDRLRKLTEANIGKKLAIVYKGKVLSEPVINAPISKSGSITGNLEKEEAEEIAAVINEAAEITTNKLDQIVRSMNAMTPEAASQVIAAWPESEFKTIIGLMDEEVRKKVLDEMDSRVPERAESKQQSVSQDSQQALPERILYDKNRAKELEITLTP